MSLRNKRGQRKYLNQAERLLFLENTKHYPLDVKLFCQLLYYTGGRIAEIYNLKCDSIDFSNKTVVIESLKKRQKGIYREIPIPDYLLEDLKGYLQSLSCCIQTNHSIWPYSLRTASRHVKRIMFHAGITGIQSSAKGLRHGFAVHVVNKVPITLLRRWLGHATLETTEIYLNVVGVEERELAKGIW